MHKTHKILYQTNCKPFSSGVEWPDMNSTGKLLLKSEAQVFVSQSSK